MTPAPDQNFAIIAVAKDEAAYIHEWVHHHLYFGFGPLFVGVNRSNDATAAILQKIAAHHPQVHGLDVNWIDQARAKGKRINEEIQELGYAFMLDKVRREFAGVEYAAFLDIDEFWYPENFDGSIQRWLAGAGYFDIASFHWACQFGDDSVFERPFENTRARLRRMVKSAINLRSPLAINQMKIHCPIFAEPERVVQIDANGKACLPKMCHRTADLPDEPQRAQILHRMTRSELEYVSRLKNGRPAHDVPIKTNRDGFVRTDEKFRLDLPAAPVAAYHASLKAFEDQCGITADIAQARDAVLASATAVLDLPRRSILAHLPHYFISLRGTTLYQKLIDQISAYRPFTREEQTQIAAAIRALEKLQPSTDHAVGFLAGLVG